MPFQSRSSCQSRSSFQPLKRQIHRWFQTQLRGRLFRAKSRYLAIVLAVALGCGSAPAVLSAQVPEPGLPPSAMATQTLVDQSRQRYDAGQLDQAEAFLRDAIQQYQTQGNPLGEAMAQSNLALVLGQKGQWREANQLTEQSLARLQAEAADRQQQSLLAQVLDVQGKLQLAQGRANEALASWKKAELAYVQAGSESGKVRSQLRQARALQAMGFYQRAVREISATPWQYPGDAARLAQQSCRPARPGGRPPGCGQSQGVPSDFGGS